ncbi:MAG: hypothetical protein ACLQNE_39120 [Thermoguttaceae bacterium]
MAIRLDLHTRDVTLLPEARPAPDPAAAPERDFTVAHDDHGYALQFDGRRVTVPDDAIQDLLTRVIEGTTVEWRYSRDSANQATFRPLNRILQRLNSTPSFQLFLAGFHIGDSIGMFDYGQIGEPAVADSFRYLVGNLPWAGGKRGRLFFIPDGYANAVVELELMANGKVVAADLYTGDAEPTDHIEHKLFVPYATPIGFNTQVRPETEQAWRQISDLIRRQGGEPTP